MSDDLATLVKRLVWHQSGGTHTMDGESHTVPTGYSVRYADENGWKWSTPLGAYGWERSPSLAKAAAQADHISKTIAALNPEALARWREEAVQAEREAIADLLEIIFAASDGIELRLGGTSETITLIEIVATIRALKGGDA